MNWCWGRRKSVDRASWWMVRSRPPRFSRPSVDRACREEATHLACDLSHELRLEANHPSSNAYRRETQPSYDLRRPSAIPNPSIARASYHDPHASPPPAASSPTRLGDMSHPLSRRRAKHAPRADSCSHPLSRASKRQPAPPVRSRRLGLTALSTTVAIHLRRISRSSIT